MIAGIGSERPLEHVLIEIGNAIADFWAPQEAVAFARMIIAESIRFPNWGKVSSPLAGIRFDVPSSVI
jgi:hypothetical protein